MSSPADAVSSSAEVKVASERYLALPIENHPNRVNKKYDFILKDLRFIPEFSKHNVQKRCEQVFAKLTQGDEVTYKKGKFKDKTFTAVHEGQEIQLVWTGRLATKEVDDQRLVFIPFVISIGDFIGHGLVNIFYMPEHDYDKFGIFSAKIMHGRFEMAAPDIVKAVLALQACQAQLFQPLVKTRVPTQPKGPLTQTQLSGSQADIVRLIENMPPGKVQLVFGGPGCGKTELAKALLENAQVAEVGAEILAQREGRERPKKTLLYCSHSSDLTNRVETSITEKLPGHEIQFEASTDWLPPGMSAIDEDFKLIFRDWLRNNVSLKNECQAFFKAYNPKFPLLSDDFLDQLYQEIQACFACKTLEEFQNNFGVRSRHFHDHPRDASKFVSTSIWALALRYQAAEHELTILDDSSDSEAEMDEGEQKVRQEKLTNKKSKKGKRKEHARKLSKHTLRLRDPAFEKSPVLAGAAKHQLVIVDEVTRFTAYQLLDIWETRLAEDGKMVLLLDLAQSTQLSVSCLPHLQSAFGPRLMKEIACLHYTFRPAPELCPITDGLYKILVWVMGGVMDEMLPNPQFLPAPEARALHTQPGEKLVLALNVGKDKLKQQKKNRDYLDAEKMVKTYFTTNGKTDLNLAIVILNESYRQAASEKFNTVMVFTAKQIQGLECDYVLLYDPFMDEIFKDAHEAFDEQNLGLARHLPRNKQDRSNFKEILAICLMIIGSSRARKGLFFALQYPRRYARLLECLTVPMTAEILNGKPLLDINPVKSVPAPSDVAASSIVDGEVSGASQIPATKAPSLPIPETFEEVRARLNEVTNHYLKLKKANLFDQARRLRVEQRAYQKLLAKMQANSFPAGPSMGASNKIAPVPTFPPGWQSANELKIASENRFKFNFEPIDCSPEWLPLRETLSNNVTQDNLHRCFDQKNIKLLREVFFSSMHTTPLISLILVNDAYLEIFLDFLRKNEIASTLFFDSLIKGMLTPSVLQLFDSALGLQLFELILQNRPDMMHEISCQAVSLLALTWLVKTEPGQIILHMLCSVSSALNLMESYLQQNVSVNFIPRPVTEFLDKTKTGKAIFELAFHYLYQNKNLESGPYYSLINGLIGMAAAERKDPYALNAVGEWFESQALKDTTPVKTQDSYIRNAIGMYSGAADRCLNASFNLGRLELKSNKSNQLMEKRALERIRKAAEGGIVPASLFLLELYSQGYTLPVSRGQILQYLINAADQGSIDVDLHIMLSKHFSASQFFNEKNVIKYTKNAAALGSTDAQTFLGQYYLSQHQPEQGLRLLQLAAQQNDFGAWYLIADYLTQLNTPAYCKEAFDCLEQAHRSRLKSPAIGVAFEYHFCRAVFYQYGCYDSNTGTWLLAPNIHMAMGLFGKLQDLCPEEKPDVKNALSVRIERLQKQAHHEDLTAMTWVEDSALGKQLLSFIPQEIQNSAALISEKEQALILNNASLMQQFNNHCAQYESAPNHDEHKGNSRSQNGVKFGNPGHAQGSRT